MNRYHAEARAGKKVAFHAQHRIVSPRNVYRIYIFCRRCSIFIGEDVQKPHAVVAHLAGNFPACEDGDGVLFRNTNAAAIEKQQRRRRVETGAWNPEIKDASTFQEKLTFFRKKEAKPR